MTLNANPSCAGEPASLGLGINSYLQVTYLEIDHSPLRGLVQQGRYKQRPAGSCQPITLHVFYSSPAHLFPLKPIYLQIYSIKSIGTLTESISYTYEHNHLLNLSGEETLYLARFC